MPYAATSGKAFHSKGAGEFAHDSLRLANRLSQLLATEVSLEQQQRLDVSIGNRLMLQRIPALLNNSQYEDRAIYHFDFYYTENYDEDVGFIATVVIEGDYSGSLTNQTCEETISIPYIETQPPGNVGTPDEGQP